MFRAPQPPEQHRKKGLLMHNTRSVTRRYHARVGHFCLAAALGLAAVGCSSKADDGSTPDDGKFHPPPPAPGFQRIVAPVVEGIKPGTDQMFCQYVFGALDRDVDVLSVEGYQSKYGHHIIAYASSVNAPLGTSRICNTEDNTQIGAFLGGIGGDAGAAVNLPEGVAFRLPKGSSIMLNTHFLNTGHDTVNGEGVLDVKFAEADPNRTLAALFVNINLGLNVAPQTQSTADATCTLAQDMKVLMFTNHMHSLGTSAFTEVTSPGGEPRMIHEDPRWTYEMQFNPSYSNWSVNAPFELKQGDVMRTHCVWNNTSTNAVKFPDEMCVGFAFFLSQANVSPTCINGTWLDRI